MAGASHRTGTGVPRPREAITRGLRRTAVVGAAAVAAVGLVVLVGGWWLDVDILRQPLPAYMAMRAGTALVLLAAGVGVVAVGLRWPKPITVGCGLLTAAIGAMAATVYFLGAPRSFVESAIAIDLDRDLAVPGRIAANTAVCLILIGSGVVLLAFDRLAGLRQVLGMAAALIAYLALIGYLASGLALTGQFSPDYVSMAPNTAIALLVLGFAVVLVSLERGWGRVFCEPLAGGQALRIAMPGALLVFAAFAGFHGAYSERGNNWETAGLAVLALAVICGLILLATRLQRIDAERVGLATDLERRITTGGLAPEQAGLLLRAQFDGAPTGMVLMGADGKSLDVNQAFCELSGYQRNDLLGMDLLNLVIEDADRERACAICAEDQTSEHSDSDDRGRADVQLRHREGRTVMARLSVGVVRDETGEPLIHICNFEDITDEVAAQHSLADSERRYRMVADGATDAVFLVNLAGVIQWASPSVLPLFGYDAAGLVGQDAAALAHPKDMPVARNVRARAALGEEDVLFEARFKCADGSYRWVAGKTGPARDPTGAIVGRLVWFHDVQEQVDTRAALGRSEQILRRAIDGAPQGMAILGLDLRFVQVNDTLCNLLGREEAWFLAHTIADVMHADDVQADLAERKLLQEGRSERFVRERRWLRADGSAVWVIHSKALLLDETGSPLGYVSHVQDNTVGHRDRDELTRRASHDALTGLINREEMLAHLTDILAASAESGATPGLLFCDVDLFKHINDTLGHATGDEVLRITGRRIAGSLRGDDVAARLGGDEFAVVLTSVPDQTAAIHIANRIRRAVSQPLSTEETNRAVAITMSVGIATATPGISARRLLRNADLALYRAKRAGRDQTAVIDDLAAGQEQADVSDGLARGEFVPWFQPIVNLADGQLAGYEALPRRVLADGSVRTLEILTLGAEASGWIADIDLTVIDLALDSLRGMSESLHLAVNVSASTLARDDYARLTIGRLGAHGIDPARLHLELSEAALLGASGSTRTTICQLAEFGVRWYVDDFGSGYSSVAPLCDLPIAGLKLDQSSTAGIGFGDPTGGQLIRALPMLADGLGLDTVAQGVRTAEEAEVLRSFGWQHGQGGLYGPPMPTVTPLGGG